MTLRQVADASDVTESHLSQIERGRANASLAALQRIGGTLRLHVGDLFSPEHEAPTGLQRFRDARALEFGDRASKIRLTPRGYDHLEVLLGTFGAGGSTGVDPYTHGDAEELLVVVEGEVVVELDGVRHHLAALDSIHYRSSMPHRVDEATGTSQARVLWAMSPPTY